MSSVHNSLGQPIATLPSQLETLKLQQMLAQPYMTQVKQTHSSSVECKRVGVDVDLRGKNTSNIRVQITSGLDNRPTLHNTTKDKNIPEVKVLRQNSNCVQERERKGNKNKEIKKRQQKVKEVSKHARELVQQHNEQNKLHKETVSSEKAAVSQVSKHKSASKPPAQSKQTLQPDPQKRKEVISKLIEESTRQEKLRQDQLKEQQNQKELQKKAKKELLQEYTEVSRKVLSKTVKKKFDSKMPWGADQRSLKVKDEAEQDREREEQERNRKLKEEKKLTREERRAQLGLDIFENIDEIKQRSKSPVMTKPKRERDPNLIQLVEKQRKKRNEQEKQEKQQRGEIEQKRLEALRKLEQEHKNHILESIKERQMQKVNPVSAKQKIKQAIQRMIQKDKELNQDNKEMHSDSLSESDMLPTKDVIINIDQSGNYHNIQTRSRLDHAKRKCSEVRKKNGGHSRESQSSYGYSGDSPIQNVSQISLTSSQKSMNAETNPRNQSQISEENYQEDIYQDQSDYESNEDYEFEYDSQSQEQSQSQNMSQSQSQNMSQNQSQVQSQNQSQSIIQNQSQSIIQSHSQSQDYGENSYESKDEDGYPGFKNQYEDYEILKPKESRQIRNPGMFDLNNQSALRGADVNLQFVKHEAHINRDTKSKKQELRKKLAAVAEKVEALPEFTHMKTDIRLKIKKDVPDDFDLKLFEIPGVLNLGNQFKKGDWKTVLYEKQTSAAVKMQKLFRGYKARKYYKTIKPKVLSSDQISKDARKILAIAYPQIYTEPNLFHKPEQFKPFQESKPHSSKLPLKLQNYLRRPQNDEFNIVDVLAREILDQYPKEHIEIESESEPYSSNFEDETISEDSQAKSTSQYEESKSELYSDSFISESKASNLDGRSYDSSPHILKKWNSKKSIPESIASDVSKSIYESKKSLHDSINTEYSSSRKFDESKSLQGSIQESIYGASSRLQASKSIPESLHYDGSTSRLKTSEATTSRNAGLTKSSEILTEISESNRFETSRNQFTKSSEIPTEISISRYSSDYHRPGRKLTIPEEVESSDIHTEYSGSSSPSRLRRSRTSTDPYPEDFESISASKSPSLNRHRSSVNLRKTPTDVYESDFEAISMSSPSPNRLGGIQPVIKDRERVKIIDPPRSEVIEALQQKLRQEVNGLDRAQQREQKLDLLLDDHKKWLDEQKLNILLKTLQAQEVYTKEIVKAKKQESFNFKKFTKEFMIQQKQAFDRLISVLSHQPRSIPSEPISRSPTITHFKPKPHEQIIESSAESYDEDFESESISQSMKSLHHSHSIPESIKSIHYQGSEDSIYDSKYDEIDESIQNESSFISDSIHSYRDSPTIKPSMKYLKPAIVPISESIKSYYDSSGNINESIQESKDSYGISESIKISGSNPTGSIKSSFREKDSGNIKVIDQSRDLGNESIRTIEDQDLSSDSSSVLESDRSEISESHKIADSYNQIEESIADYKESHDVVSESDYYKDTFEKISGSVGTYKQSVDKITESITSIKESSDRIGESIDAYKQSYNSVSQSDYYKDTFEKISGSIDTKSVDKATDSIISESIDAYKESEDKYSVSIDSVNPSVGKIMESNQESETSSISSNQDGLSQSKLTDSQARSGRFDSSLRVPEDLGEVDESIRSQYLDESYEDKSNIASPEKESKDYVSKSSESFQNSKTSEDNSYTEDSQIQSSVDIRSSIESEDKISVSQHDSSSPSFKSASVEDSEEIESEYESDFEEVESGTEREIDVDQIVDDLYLQLIKDAKSLIPITFPAKRNTPNLEQQTDQITDELWKRVVQEVLVDVPYVASTIPTDSTSVLNYAKLLLENVQNQTLQPLTVDPLVILQDISEAPLQSVILTRFPELQPILQPNLAEDPEDLTHIHNQLILEATNEALNILRPYGILGEPVPWSNRVRSVTQNSTIYKITPSVLELLKKWSSIKAGKLAPPGLDYPSEQPDQYTEIIHSDIQAEEDLWTHYEFEETQVCLDLVTDVIDFLAEETALLLNNM